MKCKRRKYAYKYFNPQITQITQIFIFLLCGNLLFAGGTSDVQHPTKVPQKIISLSPGATEVLFAVGAGEQVIARTDFCNYPSEALEVSSIGGFDGKAFSIETIIALEPDLVYATKDMHSYLQKPLEAYGIQVYMSAAQSIESIYTEIETIALLTGNKENGEKLVSNMKEQIQNVSNVVKNLSKKSVYWEVWHDPFMSAGSTSYITDVISTAGGINIFNDIKQAYPVVSEESILIRNPEVILSPSDSMTTNSTIASREGWNTIQAVQTNSIYYIDADITLRPGPRSVQAVKLIAEKLFPNEKF